MSTSNTTITNLITFIGNNHTDTPVNLEGKKATQQEQEQKQEPEKFMYIKEKDTRDMLLSAWNVITALELWDYMKKDTKSYMFNSDISVGRIYNKIEKFGYYGHSGSSFGWTMRQMQYIAQHGEEEFKNLVLVNCWYK